MANASGAHVGLSSTEHVSAGILGGSVGVIGTLLGIEWKKYNVRQASECCYCRGSGHLVCGQCLGTGELTLVNAVTNKSISLGCPTCSGMTYITCINCKGDGRSVPNFLNRKTSRDPEDELEEIGMG
ncbi:hypothetical protein JKP88DRAFT_248994 [Tribonema minus]|uniref:Uncharacterized protein n=1 Tax=Tribonema minus TaxID=303371 RepID=A0A835YP24_9STRA|nr:hypothetical protein JKP88DRAFT_248994 [Tribonema minus]